MMASISNTAMMTNTISSPSAASDQLRTRSDVMLRSLVSTRWNSRSRSVSVSAKLWKRKFEYPWPKNADPNAEGGVLRQLSYFKPLKEKPKPVTLKFERPLLELKKQIEDVRKMANETDLDFTDQIALLESKYEQALKDLYLHLTPIQRLNIARHPNRPTFLDHIFNITEKFIELHGDRAGYDDPAIVTGLGQIEGVTYVFIGHQKGRNTKENIKRNHGMPTPHGYRKALRMMQFADRKGYPIVTFVDTPGAFADLKCEELGQGESIARNLFEMAGLKVPIISIVIGEGGSGGALAIACPNKLLMLENAVFYVASPEACAAILWKTAKAAPKAAEKLKITATELCKLEICDGIIPEPLGGAHNDPAWTSQKIKEAILKSMAELGEMDEEELVEHRWYKFRKLGGYEEGTPTDPKEKSTKKRTVGSSTTSVQELESEIKKLEEHVLTASDTPTEASISSADKLIEKLQKETDAEFEQAVAALGFKDRLKSTYGELAKAKVSQDQAVVRAAQDKFAKFKDEMNQRLTAAPNYATLEKKASMLRDASKLRHLLLEQIKATPLKEEVNKKLKGFMERADVKERIEKVKAEVLESGATSFDDLDQELADRVLQLEKEIASELKEFNLNVKLIGRSEASKLMRNFEDVDGEIQEKIEEVASSSEDLKKKIDLLKSEVAKAGENPDAELRNKIQALQQEVMEDLYEALGSSDLAKLDEHETETSQTTVSSENGGMNGGVGGGVNGVIDGGDHGAIDGGGDGGGDGGVSSSRPETTVEA